MSLQALAPWISRKGTRTIPIPPNTLVVRDSYFFSATNSQVIRPWWVCFAGKSVQAKEPVLHKLLYTQGKFYLPGVKSKAMVTSDPFRNLQGGSVQSLTRTSSSVAGPKLPSFGPKISTETRLYFKGFVQRLVGFVIMQFFLHSKKTHQVQRSHHEEDQRASNEHVYEQFALLFSYLITLDFICLAHLICNLHSCYTHTI